MNLVIKLSGEGLSEGDEKYGEKVLGGIAEQIAALMEQGNRVALVVGGGNLFRGRDLSGVLGIKRSTADYIGMLATVQNALVLRDYFTSKGTETRVASAIAMSRICEEYIPNRATRHLEKGRLVIFAAGLGNPYFTTDTCAVQRSLEMGADMLIMAKNGVDGLYSEDPATNPEAVLIKKITAAEVVERELKVADLSSIALAKENNLPIKVISISDIARALEDGVGSVVES